MKYSLLILIFASISNLFATCPSAPSKGAPTCPETGRAVQLDERYPEQAYVISMSPQNRTSRSLRMPTEFIETVVNSHGSNLDAIPNFIIPTNSADFQRLRQQLRTSLTAQHRSNPMLVERVMSNLVHVEANSWTWQQDYFESFYNPTTGRPEVREVTAYRDRVSDGADGERSVRGIAATSSTTCPISSGNPLANIGALNSQMGGNIEVLPGGICMVGNNQDRAYTRQFCPEDSILNVRTDWLSVGHADEIVKVLPNPRRASPCDFAIAFASPRKALELLNENQSERFFDLSIYNGDATAMEEARRSRRENTIFLDLFTEYVWSSSRTPMPPYNPQPTRTIDGASIKNAFNIISNAYANSRDDYMANEMFTMTNGELYNAIMSHGELYDYNNLVQAEMDRIKRDVVARITQRLPQCRGLITTIDVPNLFEGAPVVRRGSTMQLPVPGAGNSLLPNPTNGVISNHTMIYPQQFNRAFNSYLASETRSQTSLRTTTIDTWDYAHVGLGNLHCSTHALRYCTPRR